jgi:pyrrolysine biosynthesis protein PylD
MTRLRTEWITHILEGMDGYNRDLREKSGLDLRGLMMKTWTLDEAYLAEAAATHRIAVVPITQGQGIITSFSESVASIVRSAGFAAEVMEHTDVDGIYEGVGRGCDIFFFADDTRYLALNIKNGRISDNNKATARGFINVLDAMMKLRGRDIHSEKLLMIGYGIVGKEAEKLLAAEKIDLDIYDKDVDTTKGLKYNILTGKDEIKGYRNILDFTNEGGWLTEDLTAPGLIYATPGVPYSPDSRTAEKIEGSAVHDDLEIGTAVMLGEVIL